MRVLITGARGQVGQSLRERAPEDWEVIFTDSKTLDITNSTTVDAMIQGFQPEVIVNTAAYTNVDQAEDEPQQAFAVNAHGAANLARAAQKVGSRLIHISTDYVFSGNTDKPYTYLDAPNPSNVYGKSKLAGETLALGLCDKTTIVRTSWVFSEYGRNFVPAITNKLLDNQTVEIYENNIGTPTYAGALADFIIELIEIQNTSNIVHYCSDVVLSRAELAHLIADQLSAQTKNNYHIEITAPVTLAHADHVVRPDYSALLSTQSKKNTEQALADLKQHILDVVNLIMHK